MLVSASAFLRPVMFFLSLVAFVAAYIHIDAVSWPPLKYDFANYMHSITLAFAMLFLVASIVTALRSPKRSAFSRFGLMLAGAFVFFGLSTLSFALVTKAAIVLDDRTSFLRAKRFVASALLSMTLTNIIVVLSGLLLVVVAVRFIVRWILDTPTRRRAKQAQADERAIVARRYRVDTSPWHVQEREQGIEIGTNSGKEFPPGPTSEQD
jgi:hypothetical protein